MVIQLFEGHVAILPFEVPKSNLAIRGCHVFGPHLRLFGVMWPFDLFRSHVAIWPFTEYCQARRICSWLIKSSYKNVISWPGLAPGPFGGLYEARFTWPHGPSKGLDGHRSLFGAVWSVGLFRSHVAISPFVENYQPEKIAPG